MKLMHVITDTQQGGAEYQLLRLVRKHSTIKELEIVVVSLKSIGSVGKELAGINRIKLYQININKSIFGVVKLAKLIKSFNPDVIQTWLYHSDLLGGIISRFFSKSVLFWNVRTLYLPQKSSITLKIVRSLCIKLSKYLPYKIICPSISAIDYHIKLGYPKNKFVYIPNGYDCIGSRAKPQKDYSFIYKYASSYNINSSTLVIGTVARFEDSKDFPNLIAAAQIIKSSYDNVIFLIVGPGIGLNNNELIGMLNKHHVNDSFILEGATEDVSYYYNIMDIYLQSSFTEAFPNVIAEAMLHSLPCVATDAGDTSTLFYDKGFIVPVKFPGGLAKKCLELLNDQQLREEVGQKNHDHVVDNFGIDSIQNMYYNLYKSQGGN